MALIPDAQLSRLQARAQDALASTAVVTRNAAPIRDGQGGRIPNPETVYSGPCGLAFAFPHSRLTADTFGGAMQALTMWRLRFPPDADVRPGDTVTVDGRVFTVQGLLSGALHLLLTVMAIEEAKL